MKRIDGYLRAIEENCVEEYHNKQDRRKSGKNDKNKHSIGGNASAYATNTLNNK